MNLNYLQLDISIPIDQLPLVPVGNFKQLLNNIEGIEEINENYFYDYETNTHFYLDDWYVEKFRVLLDVVKNITQLGELFLLEWLGVELITDKRIIINDVLTEDYNRIEA